MSLSQLYNNLADQYGDKNGEMVFTFSDKGAMHSYIEFYEKYFQAKQSNVKLLEIGLMTGGSMHLWQKYFDQYDLVGMDISPAWNQSRPFQKEIEDDKNITILFNINSQDVNCVPTEVKDRKFDFVIDDGDHSVRGQLETFKTYWPFVETGGTYFIEDVIGPEQIHTIANFLKNYCDEHKQEVAIEHYKGFKNGRADDQIVAITRK